ncbi:MAG TPA: hypothetical protein VI503_06215 [Gaiellaceae bacterium]|nr:hypothetical protein [Gaiellaceae bacterium]
MTTRVDPRAARERKQKIVVVVGGVLLLALLAIQLPRILGGSSSSAELAPPATSGEDPAAAPSTSSTRSVALVDTSLRFPPNPAKLRSFSVFTPKDPFVQQVRPASDTSSESTPTTETSEPSQTKPATDSFTADKTASPVTVIAVNGRRHALIPGTAFPTADPVFVLVANRKSAGTVTIAVARGTFADGSNRTKVTLEKPLVLVNRATGVRYRLVLLAVGTGAGSTKTSEGSFQIEP